MPTIQPFALERRRLRRGLPSSRPPLPIETSIKLFDGRVRRKVRNLVRKDSRLQDLAVVFPGAMHAIASRRAGDPVRQTAIDLVLKGAPLKRVAATLGVPMWLRSLPPHAFVTPIRSCPVSDTFSRRIATRIPGLAVDPAFWLSAVTFAADAAHEDFAIWLADKHLQRGESEVCDLLPVACLYAWFSTAEPCPAQQLIGVAWRPELRIDTAVCAAKSWLNRIKLVMELKPGVVCDPWLEPGTANGYTFTPLLSAAALLQEARTMNNCVDQLGARLLQHRSRLFSVTNETGSVATLEIAPYQREPGILGIHQLKGRHNMPAPTEIWQSAHAWMSRQPVLRRPANETFARASLCQSTWAELMGPYRSAKGPRDWLPETIDADGFSRLEASIASLAARARVTSWLFA